MRRKSLLISLMLVCVLLSTSFIQSVAGAREQEKESAGVGISISDETIPQIQIGNWTSINLTVYDTFGLDWDMLQTLWYPEFWMRTVWRFQFGLPEIERYLGYTSILLEPEVVSEDGTIAEGWKAKIGDPSAEIGGTTQGMTHERTLYVQVTDRAGDYNPIVKIKCTRFDVLGDLYNVSYVNIPVKAVTKPYVNVELPETIKKAPPKSIVYIPIQITNYGEYRDTYQFKISGQNGIYGLVSEQSLVLESGETKTINVEVLTPEVFYDYGTNREIYISVYSVKNPGETYTASAVVITEGLYISPLIIMVASIIIIFLAIVIFLLYLRKRGFFAKIFKRRKKVEKIEVKKPKKEEGKKPEKPETKAVSEEKQKEKAWNRFAKFFKRSEKKEVEKPLEEQETKEEKIEEAQKIEEIESEEIKPVESKKEEKKEQQVDTKADLEKRKKEKAILKIKREQEKQRRKFKK